MASVFWIGNAANKSQRITGTINAVANGATITATLNTKTLTYTCTATDTTTTAATAVAAMLNASTVPPEFTLASYAASGAIVTCTARTPGTPFAGMTNGLVLSAAGGAAITQATAQANVSQSSAIDANNWLRAGSPGIPQNGDAVTVANSTVPILWDLDGLAAVQFASYTRWQSFEGTIGLPENNPLGFYEFRQTYFQFVGSGTLTMILGANDNGSGPSRERYNVGAQRTNLVVLNSGSASDDYAIRFLGSHASNTVNVTNTSVGVAMLPTEVSTIASGEVANGGTLALGSGVTFSGALIVNAATAVLYCAPATLTIQNGSTVTVGQNGLTFAAIVAQNNCFVNWNCNSTITALTLQAGCVFSKQGDSQATTITNATIDGDTCQALDPNSVITWTNAASVKNQVSSGPFTFAGTRAVKVT